MPLLEDVADDLVKRTLKIIATTGDEKIEKRISEEIGALSPTLQEHFNTAMRIRKAEARALKLLGQIEKGAEIPPAAISAQPQDGGH